MIYARLILIAFIVLGALYYAMVVGHLFGLFIITKKKISFLKLLIPFYYWIK